MNFALVFFLTTLPGGISTILLIVKKKKVDNILLKDDNSYVSVPNSNDLVRIYKVYRKNNSLNKSEKKLLLLTMYYLVIAGLTIISWLTVFIFFIDWALG
jgi:hypothetical protein